MNFDMGNEADQAGAMVDSLMSGGKPRNRLYVPVFKFDELLDYVNLNPISVLKIDVEGAELNVLYGLIKTLREQKIFIICEILWAHLEEKLEETERRNTNIKKFLDESDYLIFQIIKSADNNFVDSLKKISKLQNQVFSEENRILCEYLILHKEEEYIIKDMFTVVN